MFDKRPVIYIGFDAREKTAYDVLRNSIMEHNDKFDIIPLVQTPLRRAGLYRRSARLDSIDGNRVMVDTFDGRPFSTEFTFTRFLIPALNQYEGLALFMDSDMLVRADIEEIFETYGSNKDIALHCVKHNYNPSSTTKMDGQIQQSYNRKNWSSFMLFNCGHPANLNLSVDDANTKSGSWLHGMSWLKDEEIGSIPEEWNWLDGWSDERIVPKNVHFTTGGPWFAEWEPKRNIDAEYAGEWQVKHKEVFYNEALGDLL